MSRQPQTDRDALWEISALCIDPWQPIEQKREKFLRGGDPLHFRCGEVEVEVRFSPDGPTLEQALCALLRQPSEK